MSCTICDKYVDNYKKEDSCQLYRAGDAKI
jgi:hypothetical protein